MVAVRRTPFAVAGSVSNPGVVCDKEPAGGFTSAELFLTIVMVVVRVEVRMDVTIVETTGGTTVMGDRLVAAFEKSKVAEISKVVVATVVGMMVVIVGTASGDMVMYIGTGKIDGDCVAIAVVCM
jgi:hypothetical protein